MEHSVELVGSGAERTTLDGQGAGSVVTLNGAAALEDFTVTGGNALEGGGVHGNRIALDRPSVRRCVVRNNTAGSGGGLFGTFDELEELLVELNTGDGLWIQGGNLLHSRVRNNSGDGVFISFGASVRNSLVVDNSGSGILIQGEFTINSGDIEHNVIAGNAHGLLESDNESSGSIAGNIIVNNAGIGVGALFPIADSNVWNNGTNGITPGIDGNLSADPQFRDPSNDDYRLSPTSPCVDSGPTLTLPYVDLDGFPRPLDGDLDGTAVSDMGLYEYRGEVSDLVIAADGETLQWDAHPAGVYNLYRSDLVLLKSGGGYTQDPVMVPLADRWCGLLAPQQTDNTTPDAGDVAAYLATVVGTVEGSLGFDSTPTERVNPSACP